MAGVGLLRRMAGKFGRGAASTVNPTRGYGGAAPDAAEALMVHGMLGAGGGALTGMGAASAQGRDITGGDIMGGALAGAGVGAAVPLIAGLRAMLKRALPQAAAQIDQLPDEQVVQAAKRMGIE